jgi:hypothetical protein
MPFGKCAVLGVLGTTLTAFSFVAFDSGGSAAGAVSIFGQFQEIGAKDFKSYEINKRVCEYSSRYDLGTPLDSFLTFKYLESEGRQGLYRSVNSFRIRGFFPAAGSPDSEIKPEARDKLLQTKIKEIIVYKDSIAGVITDYVEPMCIITYLSLEDGKWLNAGEGLGNDLNDARKRFEENAAVFLSFIDRIREMKSVPADPAPFIDFLRQHGRAPKEFILDALSRHKIIVYGEIHRRRLSWDLLKTVIRDSHFAEKVGTIFMELSSDKQNRLDEYFESDELDTGIILDIFRDVQINGWYDKGMYEFLEDAWKMNKKLPKAERIQVVAVDESRPIRTFTAQEELENHFRNALNRNTQMAEIIAEAVRARRDKRNSLFVVGVAHAYKSAVPGIAVGRPKNGPQPTAAAQLAKIFGDKEVFSIFQHCPVISNDGAVHGKIRNGLFDKAFAAMGNRPVAFNLRHSPFGAEPFDGIYEVSYDKDAGNWDNNYDAYLYLEPLESEPAEYLLYDVINDAYVRELVRRAEMMKTSVNKWFDVEEVTTEAIISKLKSQHENQKRWPSIK